MEGWKIWARHAAPLHLPFHTSILPPILLLILHPSFFILLLGLGLLWTKPAAGEEYAASFLRIGVGARALGMGGAMVSLVDDGTAAYWNPAGLALVRTPQLSMTHAFLFETLADHDFVNATVPLHGGVVLGFSWIRLSVDDIPRFSSLVGGRTGTSLRQADPSLQGTGVPDGFFDDTEDAYMFSFAKMYTFNPGLGAYAGTLPIEWPVAANLKYIRQSIGSDTGNGIGLDLGMMLRMGLEDLFGTTHAGHLTFGLNIRDVTGTRIRWDTRTTETVDPSARMGFSYTQPLRPLNGTLIIAEQHNIANADPFRFGVEYWYENAVAVRLGHEDHFTAGAGMILWRFMIDYAFINQELGGTHRVSGSFNF